MKTKIKLLEWDSNFFEFKIANLNAHELDNNSMIQIIKDLTEQRIRLLYIYVSPDDIISQLTLSQNKVPLICQNVTFTRDIHNGSNYDSYSNNVVLTDIDSKHLDLDSLQSITLQSGEYSRFNLDRKIGIRLFQRLYLKWLEESLKKNIADIVLTFTDENQVQGLITASEGYGNIGKIGLIAVDKKFQGKSIGKKLTHCVFNYFLSRNITTVKVVTQLENNKACNFYRKLGFREESVINIYHYWSETI